MDPNNLPGPLKVAILIKSLGEEASQDILAILTDNEKEIVRKHMSQLGEISFELVEKVARDFTTLAEKKKARQLAQRNSKDDEKGERSKLVTSSKGYESVIKTLDPDTLLKMIKDEYPQTIAIILAHVEPDVASEVLSKLPDDIKPDVAIRIARLKKVVSDMIEEIDLTISEVLSKKDTSKTEEAGGVGRLADILNQIDSDSSDLILNEMEELDPELAALTRQGMFVFEDLVLVDDKGLQKLLRSVETKDLAIALKGATEAVKEKVFKNMSERAGEMVADEIEAIGSVRMKEVEAAQQMITKIIQDLHQKNEIIIAGRGGEELVV
ncbi:putative Flagellar motor switch protein FliG [uncultured Desulfobacterium sp.]|uniref:Flagellar motor switch protein FliG n=1 Tax=uncultured Desulfobacterium sp. TaxID=201089 RepID=A0A445MTK7_9BACT|nr:putative Flagellar motor switch protein FliG [uncultured Desulfobacterium sp.]